MGYEFETILGQLGRALDAEFANQAKERTQREEEAVEIKNLLNWVQEWWTGDRDKKEKEIIALKEKIEGLQQKVEVFKGTIVQNEKDKELKDQEIKKKEEKIASLNESLEKMKAQNQQKTQDLEGQIETLKAEIGQAKNELERVRTELGSDYAEFEGVYHRFKASPWAQEDTAMKHLYGQDFVTFFGLCGCESVVKEFYDDLRPVIQEKGEEYRKMANALLNFCVAACGRLHPFSKYCRQAAQANDPYEYRNHIQCAGGDGKTIKDVFLQGIVKDDRTLLCSYIERDA